VSPAVARERIVQRNGLTPEQADQRIAAQLTNEQRAGHAQVIIDNSGTLDDLRARVDAAWSERVGDAVPGARALTEEKA
jgi:dephospho-CoA kinase